ncbi:hypothetical protein ABE438_17390 [Bosea sp. TWI1241]|uniref:hypothetical protein n=1 Tax=Bosea sp. TWI1241 TaxID=3148904 RepID=UPI003207C865
MSRTDVKIPLDPPVVIGTKRYEYVKVRAPGYHDYMDFGEVLQDQRNSEGVLIRVEHIDRIKAYAERLVTTGDDESADPAVLHAAGFRIARRVHEVICDFLYSQPDATGTASPTS